MKIIYDDMVIKVPNRDKNGSSDSLFDYQNL